MGWLVSSTLASIVASFIAMKVFDYVFAGVTGGLVGGARLGLFVVTWTAITAQSGMHGVTSRIGGLRRQLSQRKGGT